MVGWLVGCIEMLSTDTCVLLIQMQSLHAMLCIYCDAPIYNLNSELFEYWPCVLWNGLL